MNEGKEKGKGKAWWPLALAAGAVGAAATYRALREPQAGALPGADAPGTVFISGASSGIGAAFARRLADAGYDLIISARRAEKLEALAAELKEEYGIAVRVEPGDLSLSTDINRLEKLLAVTDDLDLVINNAGFGTNGALANMDVEKQADMVQLHVMAPMRLTRAALPGMMARQRGGIINVSSIAAFMSNPTSINYCATKAYLNTFSEGLQKEVASHGIQVQALCPGYTYSEFHDTPEYEAFNRSDFPELFWMTSDEVAAASLAALGSGDPIFVPGAVNKVLARATRSRTARLILGAIRARGKLL